jgi:hypothetical protein
LTAAGEDAEVLWPSAARRIVEARLQTGLTGSYSVEEFGQQIEWDISAVLADPAALWEMNVEGLYNICQTLGLDWVAALPSICISPSAR